MRNTVEAGNLETLGQMFELLSELCDTAARPVVLMIDEVDSASNNQIFLDFLAQLRGYYLDREQTATFHSVILAGVYDIKNLKLKIRPEEEHRFNSPWNIAESFDIDMSFSVCGIAGMLSDYEADHHNEAINLGSMFGYMKNCNGSVVVSNRIFEMWLYNRFLSEDELRDAIYDEAQRSQNQFVRYRGRNP